MPLFVYAYQRGLTFDPNKCSLEKHAGGAETSLVPYGPYLSYLIETSCLSHVCSLEGSLHFQELVTAVDGRRAYCDSSQLHPKPLRARERHLSFYVEEIQRQPLRKLLEYIF